MQHQHNSDTTELMLVQITVIQYIIITLSKDESGFVLTKFNLLCSQHNN